MAPMIRVSNVGHRYHGADREALTDVSFTVEAGTCFGLLGPNGAGKSTLFALMTGVLALQRGAVEIDGVNAATEHRRLRDVGAIAPQDLAFYPGLTGRQNLEFFAGAYRLDRSVWRENMAAAVAAAQIEDVLDRRAETYSGGLQRRLNLAIALLKAPKVLYLDEPTVGIDARSRAAIVEAIAALKAKGVTIVYTSHYMEEVETLCDSLCVVDRGRIVALGGKDEVLRRRDDRRLHVTLDGAPTEAARKALAVQGAEWLDADRLVLPVSGGGLAESLQALETEGVRIAQLRFGTDRLEHAYLSMLDNSAQDNVQ